MNKQKIESAIEIILKELNYDSNSSHFKDTPKRVAKMFAEFSNAKEPLKLTTFPNEKKIDQMIILTDITFYSFCAHHIIPFFGRACIAYIPGEALIGLSKLSRIVRHFSDKFQIQENLTDEIASYIEEKLRPLGLAVQLEGEHLCMSMRGVKDPGTKTITTALRGVFLDDVKARNEFLSSVR